MFPGIDLFDMSCRKHDKINNYEYFKAINDF